MQAIEILDIKPFMVKLFQGTIFDTYKFISGEVHTDITYQLDGHIHSSFFSEEEAEEFNFSQTAYLPWQKMKEKIFFLIKGKKTPSQLKLVLRLDEIQAQHLLAASGATLSTNEIDAMYVNILFQNNRLQIVCGVSYNIFTMEKSLETEFAQHIITIFKANGITSEFSA